MFDSKSNFLSLDKSLYLRIMVVFGRIFRSLFNNRIGNSLLRKAADLYREKGALHPDLEKDFWSLYNTCKDFTMTSVERMYSIYNSVDYILKSGIEGDFVECGVWKGGSAMMMLLTLMKYKVTDRMIYLYDTFAGMSEPTEKDMASDNLPIAEEWKTLQKGDVNEWCYASIDEVKRNVFSTGYPAGNIKFVQGRVEDTIPGVMPQSISLLRLDTDWYESTYHELKCLYPKLSAKGVLILDDYGHWKGAKEAADRYFSENKINILLDRIDYTGRIAIKM
jgi:O-methyltransferase